MELRSTLVIFAIYNKAKLMLLLFRAKTTASRELWLRNWVLCGLHYIQLFARIRVHLYICALVRRERSFCPLDKYSYQCEESTQVLGLL